jgi:hypothetical protein
MRADEVDRPRRICNAPGVPGWRVAIAVALFCFARPAAAEDPPFTIGAQPAWLLLGGVTTGGTVALGDRGALVGGELSLARLREASFAGIYADGYYDWGAHGTYATAGLELGHKYVGVDGGVALRFDDMGTDMGTDVGATGRVTVGLGVVGVYARYAHFWDAMANEDILQVGLMLKLPLWTSGL